MLSLSVELHLYEICSFNVKVHRTDEHLIFHFIYIIMSLIIVHDMWYKVILSLSGCVQRLVRLEIKPSFSYQSIWNHFLSQSKLVYLAVRLSI